MPIQSSTPAYRGAGLSIQERAIDKKTGLQAQKFVGLEDKLFQWVKLISPRFETFDKGAQPYQSFRAVLEYRNSIVHLAATKAEKYRSIDFKVAMDAVTLALEVAQSICRFIAPDPKAVAFPTWLLTRKPDGLFDLSATISLFAEGSTLDSRECDRVGKGHAAFPAGHP